MVSYAAVPHSLTKNFFSPYSGPFTWSHPTQGLLLHFAPLWAFHFVSPPPTPPSPSGPLTSSPPTQGLLLHLAPLRAFHFGSSHSHNDSLWHPLHTKEGDEISMFWGPCLQSSISRLSFSFLALFFCYAVSSCVYDHNHPYLVSERLFLAENEAFPYLRRALAHLRRALAILWDAAATWPVVIFVVVAAKQRSPKMSVACVQGPVDRLPYRSPPVTLNGHCGVILQ